MSDRSTQVWEERWHPLREEWVIVAAHRQGRPWVGASVRSEDVALPAHDPGCFLCPGNTRVSGVVNPPYDGIYVFDNDHPCVGVDAPAELEQPPAPYAARRADGIARVICYTPRHDLTLARMSAPDVTTVVDSWRRETRELATRPGVKQVLIFEN